MMRIDGEVLSAVINLRRGAKITSLIDAAGTEWLARGNADPHAVAATSFVDAEMQGWDECAPTIVACRVADHDLPDHGDLWDAEFDVDGHVVSAHGTSLPYRFQRRIEATPTGLRFDYSAESLAGPIPFLWAAHPQFAAPPGTRIELPSTIDSVIEALHPSAPELAWTPGLSTIDTLSTGECRKVYVAPSTSVHHARLVRPDGSTLIMRWSDTCPYLGIWFDQCAYSATPVIALEPTTAYYDSLERAVQLGHAPLLEPGRPLRWWVELEARPAS
jgi:galactose mutarotase-like enzyme